MSNKRAHLLTLACLSFAASSSAQDIPSAKPGQTAKPISTSSVARPSATVAPPSTSSSAATPSPTTRPGVDAGAPKTVSLKNGGDAGVTSVAMQPSDEQQQMPHNHPSMDEITGRPGIPADGVEETTALPAGTIVIELRDVNEQPRPGASITVGKIEQSIAKGESRTREELTTDASGKVILQNQASGSGFAYRVSTKNGPATYAARPFNLPQDKGVHVVLHTYETTTSLEDAVILTGLVLVAELREDRIQLDEVLTVANRGRTAWVPDDVILELPPEFTALTAQQSMSDQGIDPVPGKGARLKGTFAPGQHQVEFRWQLPRGNGWERILEGAFDLKSGHSGSGASITIGASPHLAKVQAVAAVGDPIKFSATGFPAAVVRFGQNGDRLLVTQRELQMGDPPLKEIQLEISDIPGPGPWPFYATMLTIAFVGLGVYAQTKRERVKAWFKTDEAKHSEKDDLLRELDELETAKRKDEVGPKTYERAKREITQALAQVIQRDRAEELSTVKPARKKSKRSKDA